MGGVAPPGGSQPGPLFISSLGFTTDNAAASSPNKTGACQESADSWKARACAAEAASQPGLARERGFEERTRRCRTAATSRASRRGVGRGRSRAKPRAWDAHQTPRRRQELPRRQINPPNSASYPEEAPLLRVTGLRTASGARPARAAVLADFALIGWTVGGVGEGNLIRRMRSTDQ